LHVAAVVVVAHRRRYPHSEVTAKQYFTLLVMIALCVAMSYIDLMIILQNSISVDLSHVALELCVAAMPVFIFFVFERFQEHAYEAAHSKTLRLQLAQNEKQFETLEAHQMEIRKLKHDVVGQLAVIKDMAEQSGDSNLLSYINDFESELAQPLEKTWTGLSSTDALISSKRHQAAENGIGFEVRLPSLAEIKINPVHLNNILLNALDNAIEACISLPNTSERYITLGMKSDDQYIFIKVRNTSLPVEIEDGVFPRTHKPDASSHGIGLSSILESVERYGGIMNIEYEENCFSLLLRLWNSKSHPPVLRCLECHRSACNASS
jgi:sensor histidine kinase regulating citrate/malate metabolism